jgi:divalent metal cation (Fe/Co/Zn/Cd) transporter
MLMSGTTSTAESDRPRLLARALRLEYLTVGWNIVEGVIAIAAATASGSVALLGFGIDSFVESASGSVMIWRLLAERHADEDDEERIEHVERRARKLVAASLVLLAVYIAWDSITSLISGDRPQPSMVGIVLALASLLVMWWLARQKRRVGVALGSRAMTADAFQTDACFWLSLFLLVGIGANALFGFWWADPLAALGMTFFIGREAIEAWRADDD